MCLTVDNGLKIYKEVNQYFSVPKEKIEIVVDDTSIEVRHLFLHFE